ncbi:PREDICTED: wiskott-Aldrich syndrome protein family member 3 [Rhagoletis zephyria]|uniref:wiskott-Aldrich syndrome protein family member 3 n=1 Tax=Rhagoletis zephyria TaxID=28612 RepID=UPI0008118528|nr:PREDICTED: wiskott-Aldrich syndrome protein family member 3 [Rhagoletis zephyria]
MPLPKRSIVPVHVSRSAYHQDEPQIIELETVTNTSLTNIIRQLSSLSKHAEDIFGELARDVGNISSRANSLQARIDHLSIKVTQLDSTIEDVPLTDITRKKGFRSTKTFDQKIFSHSTMPAPMLETYTMCDKPPPLNKLNNYRDDGKDGLKFYTDPNYFFELWRQEMLKDTERVMHDKGKKLNRPRQDGANSNINIAGGKKRVRKPHNTREKQRLLAIGQGETLMPNNITYQTPNSIINIETGFGNVGVLESRHHRPNSINLRKVCNSEQAAGNCGDPLTQSCTTITSAVANAIGIHSPSIGKTENGILAIHSMQCIEQAQLQDLYDDETFNENQRSYEQFGSEGICAQGMLSRTKIRPSQPPPDPPSNGSRHVTPVSSNANTPTRTRNGVNNRDILPPPPPIPEALMNTSSPPRSISVINGNTSLGKNIPNINLINIPEQPNWHDLPPSAQPEHQVSMLTNE